VITQPLISIRRLRQYYNGWKVSCMAKLCCSRCGRCWEPYPIKTRCTECGGFLLPVSEEGLRIGRGKGVWRFSGSLASTPPKAEALTLGEGDTPLIKASRLASRIGLRELFVKDESRNPTGTFIDRGAATLVSAAGSQGYRRLVVASLGDLAVSLGAYANRAGISVRSIVPRSTDLVRAYQALIYSDRVDLVESYTEALSRLSKISMGASLPVDSSNPYLLDGYKTIYYEIYIELGGHPDVLVVPMGDGALLTALWRAARDLGGSPLFIGVRGCADSPLLKDIAPAKPLMRELVEEILVETGGYVTEVCEDELLETIRLVARSEGLLLEPVGVAALATATRLGENFRDKLIVAVATGGPLRDSAVLRMAAGKPLVEEALGPTKQRILEIVVSRGPIHSYGVWRVLRESYRVDISLRTLYQHMRELEEKGYIRRAGRRNVNGRIRVLYEASEKGLEAAG